MRCPKVFEIGHGKTGSTSLYFAMRRLGYRSCHWPIPASSDWLPKVLLGDEFDFDFVRDFDFIGNGIERFYKQLDQRYKDAKFILLIRDEEEWLDSYERHLRGTRNLNQAPFFYTYLLSSYGVGNFNRELWRDRFREHTQAVQKYFSAYERKLLVLNVCGGEGYERLCPFLGMPILNEPFPHENAAGKRVVASGSKRCAAGKTVQPDLTALTSKYKGLKKWGWYLDDALTWIALLRREQPVRALEVGAFDGVSANLMLDLLFTHSDSEVHCIDPYEPDKTTPEVTESTEAIFLENRAIGKHEDRVYLYKGISAEVLAWMAAADGFWERFDFIYIDGSHIARDVFIDVALCWNLLKPGGVLIFDDYEWAGGKDVLSRPRLAIDAFERIFAEVAEVCLSGWRRGFRKRDADRSCCADAPRAVMSKADPMRSA